MNKTLTIRDAVERLDGHNILSETLARQICTLLEISFPEQNLMSWQTIDEAYEKYGFFATQAPSTGIDGLDLSYHVVKELGIDPPGRAFIGKGFQSRANQQAIRQHLSIIGNYKTIYALARAPNSWPIRRREMLFVRIGKYALDLHTCVFTQMRTESTDVKGIHVQSPFSSFTVWNNQQPETYAELKSYVMAMPTLAEINDEREASESDDDEPERNWEAEAQEATYISDVEDRYYQCDEEGYNAYDGPNDEDLEIVKKSATERK